MKRIAVFRFHRRAQVCRDRVALLRALNPGVEVHGLFGGSGWYLQTSYRAVDLLGGMSFSSLYRVPGDRGWRWRNSDLVLRSWYRAIGSKLEFDVAHVVEWDLLLLDSLGALYGGVPADAVALTGLVPLREIESRWPWTIRRRDRHELDELLAWARNAHGYEGEPHACLGPGPCFPREFLERYSALDVPELCHDEIRLPLAAQILGFDLFDTGFYRRWFDPEEERFFNADDSDIEDGVVERELALEHGRRAFHPYRRIFRHRLGLAAP